MTIKQTEFTNQTFVVGGQGTAGEYFALLKPRVMSLVVFTAFVGLLAAPGHIHPWMGFITIFCIALGAGAAGALNMWYEADIDAVMKRTSKRPIPSGAILPGEALGFGLTLAVASVLMMELFVNWHAAALLAFTIFFYVVIYTMGLKRWTAQNIVIGGAAGSFPPMVAWAAVNGQIDLGSISLFLLIFMWTPPHFWALALFAESDYEKAGIPMLPNVSGRPETRKQILIYTLLMIPAVALPCLTGTAGMLYAVGAGLLTAWFLKCAIDVYRIPEGPLNTKACKALFKFSIYWLFAVFALIMVERITHLPTFASVF